MSFTDQITLTESNATTTHVFDLIERVGQRATRAESGLPLDTPFTLVKSHQDVRNKTGRNSAVILEQLELEADGVTLSGCKGLFKLDIDKSFDSAKAKEIMHMVGAMLQDTSFQTKFLNGES